ncbi:leucine-rich repeat-containing protein 56 isoform X3 [Heterocephalus glaber]|uniref:Leucine-rich repeat-containing protein 56 isoform X3 n=1 Tax=Heterocephalus glaber TaxID=10181 RepID=A0AAX6THY4_HETGA|nr:leucine-rich repeat-containing protein 56 isoform X3 [Heterocephalus glaber]
MTPGPAARRTTRSGELSQQRDPGLEHLGQSLQLGRPLTWTITRSSGPGTCPISSVTTPFACSYPWARDLARSLTQPCLPGVTCGYAAPTPGCLTHSRRQLPTAGCMWMDPAGDGCPRPRPYSASVRVREMSRQGLHNPSPQSKGPEKHQAGHKEQRMEEPLSPTHLVRGVLWLQVKVSSGDQQPEDSPFSGSGTTQGSQPLLRLYPLPRHQLSVMAKAHTDRQGIQGILPLLQGYLGVPQKKSWGVQGQTVTPLISAAAPGSGGRPPKCAGAGGVCGHPRAQPGELRDLGTSLGHLQVLWLARCGLADLDGISSFPALQELYVSYNNISDLSPLCLLDQLKVLDLEGNSVEDLEQVRYLQLCPRLTTLTLEGNLVCLQPAAGPANKAPGCYNYRAEVRKLVPQLCILDEVPTTCADLPAPREMGQDWLMVKEAIKEGSMLGSVLPSLDQTHGATLQKRDPALSLPETPPWVLSLLGPLTEGLLPEDPALEDHASNLTYGAGQVLCGNLTKGLWERRHQFQARVTPEQLSPTRPGLAASPSTPQPDSTDSHGLLVLAGLPAWRELDLWPLGSQQEGAAAPQDPRRAPEHQEDQTGPRPSPGLASEPSKTLGCHLTPSPPKNPMPPDPASSSPRGSADLQVRGRRLRALGSLGPGLGKGLASVTTLRALEGASGPTLKPSDILSQSQPWIQQPDPQPSAACGT